MLLTTASIGGAVSALIVSVASPVLGSRTGTGTVTSAAASVTITNGVGPYTYSWTYVSGDSFTINTPSGTTTTFTVFLSAGQQQIGTYRVTVTDTGAGSVTASANFTVIMEAL